MGGTHDASEGLRNWGLPVDVGRLGLRRSRGQGQQGLTSPRAKVRQRQLGARQRDSHLQKQRGN